ncbi:MAG: hypothetical protein KGH86_02895 [Thaumarchaeota archaeon]|nr:hypothetical protein [Nitrososphaerota archaeon]
MVPTPTSSLITPGSLWVPQRIAKALVRKGLGKTVIECVKRVKALPRSSKSLASNRPKAQDHYDSVEVENILSNPTEILLIDDVVTRGATLLGVANKLADAFLTHVSMVLLLYELFPIRISLLKLMTHA